MGIYRFSEFIEALKKGKGKPEDESISMHKNFSLGLHVATRVRYGYLNKHFLIGTVSGLLLKLDLSGKSSFVIFAHMLSPIDKH